MAAAVTLALAAYLALVLLIARCCGINDRLDPETPMTPQDIIETAEGARGALGRVESTCLKLLSHETRQSEGQIQIARAMADLEQYQGLLISYAAALTTPPPYYPGNLESDIAAARAVGEQGGQNSARGD